METPRRGGGGSSGRKSDIAVPPPLVPQHELSRTELVSRHFISCLKTRFSLQTGYGIL